MKRYLLIVAFVCIAMRGLSQNPNGEPPEESVVQIEQHTKEMADNTKPILVWNGKAFDSWVLLAVSLCSFAVGVISTTYSIRTTRHAKQTALNVKEQTLQQEINRPAQDAILKDLILHLYRNKVVACAIRWKLTDMGFDKCYPSEEYLLKMKVLPEDLRLDRFDTSPSHYGQLHKLRLLFRNYTIEVDVALEHLKTKYLAESVKVDDLLDLEFKSQMLTEKIRDLMECSGLSITDEDIRGILLVKDNDCRNRNRDNHDPDNVPERSGDDFQYYDRLGLTAQLNEAISREYSMINTIEFING